MIFYKYHGTGNDFILIDGRKNISLSKKNIEYLCKRHFGIGSDGLLILKNSKTYDFIMDFYNPDGSQATFCGNGARCIVKFAQFLKIIKNKTIFQAKDGTHNAHIQKNKVSLQMLNVEKIKEIDDLIFLNTGTAHTVKFVNDIENINIEEARKIRYNKKINKKGTNVNFVQIFDNYIKIRTYEKGVEAETLSCGTGVTAAAIAYAYKTNFKKTKIYVKSNGGDLSVSFKKKKNIFNDIFLTGNAIQIFKGYIHNF